MAPGAAPDVNKHPEVKRRSDRAQSPFNLQFSIPFATNLGKSLFNSIMTYAKCVALNTRDKNPGSGGSLFFFFFGQTFFCTHSVWACSKLTDSPEFCLLHEQKVAPSKLSVLSHSVMFRVSRK